MFEHQTPPPLPNPNTLEYLASRSFLQDPIPPQELLGHLRSSERGTEQGKPLAPAPGGGRGPGIQIEGILDCISV